MKVSFLGAAREVTGSNILVEAAGKKMLLDCGFFQGRSFDEERNYFPFAYDPKSIDVLVVCHAHLDHVGRIPKLVREGFVGKIFSTAPTQELATLVMEDNAKLMREEAKRNDHQPLYLEEDIQRALQLFEAIPYHEEIEIVPGIKLTFFNAGHILGSSFAKVRAEGKTLVYSSDLGNVPSKLLDPRENIDDADFVICETTYGARVHEDISKRSEKLASVINSTVANGGVLMIPTFAIERTQELLSDIEHFCVSGNCAIPNFYLDSPLAQKVTKVFEKYPEFLKKGLLDGPVDDVFGLERVKMTPSVFQSKEINSAPSPKIIIAGSGMMNGGRILFHLQNYIEDAKNTLLIVGYQAKGTLGRKLFDGEKEVKIYGKKYNVRARILAIGSYSAHADSVQLLDWVGSGKGLKKVFLVHGESEQSIAFSKAVFEKLHVDVQIPQYGETCEV